MKAYIKVKRVASSTTNNTGTFDDPPSMKKKSPWHT
jgi:hypothetical protein